MLKNESGKIENHYTIVCFECIYKESTLKPSYEIEELGWFKLENIKNLHLVSTTKMALKDAGMM